MAEDEIIAPRSLKQKAFIDSRASITIFGGAMGSGKTYLGVMAFLPYIPFKNFRGLILRRTLPELKGSGGVLDTCKDLFFRVDPKARWKEQQNKFVFSSGAEIYLRPFEREEEERKLQGLQANLILVDEAQFFTERQVLFLESRNRYPKCTECPPRMLLTANPLKSSFLRKWLDKWIDKDGYPDKERECQTYYASRQEGHLVVSEDKESLVYFDERTGDRVEPKSITFIPANIYDNPVLMKNDPTYINKLHGMSPVDKAKYLYGSWDAEEKSSGYWKKEWCEFVELAPMLAVKRVRAWDLAGTLESELNTNPDYTVGALLSRDKFGNTYVEDIRRFRARFGEVFEKMVEVAKEDGDDVLISVPQDAGSAGKAYAMTMIRDLADLGYYAKAKPSNKSKLTRFAPFCAASEAGTVKIVTGEWNEAFISELEDFDGGKSRAGRKHDD